MAVEKDEFAVRAGAAYAFEVILDMAGEGLRRAVNVLCYQCYLSENSDSQIALVSTLTPPPPDNPNAGQGGTYGFVTLALCMVELSHLWLEQINPNHPGRYLFPRL